MGGFRSIHLSVLAAIVGLAFSAASAQAGDVVADATCCTFAAGPFTQAQGETSSLDNQGDATAFHNVTSTGFGPDREPLFVSETIPGPGRTTIPGTQYLATGSYPFVCTLHPGMSGDLEVSAEGTPVARPGVKLTVPAQKLKQVRRSGKLKVKVTPVAPSTGVSVEVRKGAKLIGVIPSLNLTTAAKTVPVKLTKAGRKSIAKGKKVKVSVASQVPFGAPAKAARVLR